ncbi:MAG TPA: tyrosine/phenylalanine carboxypeptidase domain-containing protein, partial [Yinghuangia sp.]|nr:tyrosine/phenylalanine carboxypeptidase domain-containing protein [Yinghuangia sp.]
MRFSVENLRAADAAARRLNAALARTSLLKVVLPKDVEGHRERFIQEMGQGRPRDPVFDYPDVDRDRCRPLRQIADEYGSRTDAVNRLIAEEALRHLATYRACTSRDSERITWATSQENGAPSEALLAEAVRLLEARPTSDATGRGREFSAEQVLSAVERTLAAAGLTDWSVRVTPAMAARMSVVAGDRLVRIRSDIRLTEGELVGLITHEIGTHVYRWVNACRIAGLLGVRLSGATATEEGLAVWNELRATGDVALDPRFALRVIAVSVALRGSFVDVVAALLPYTSPEAAFDAAVRVKRGLIDTAEPGGFIKDHVYMAGHHMVRCHLARNPDDFDLLMVTKWPLAHLDGLRAADPVSLI